jgi:hypothetical protein
MLIGVASNSSAENGVSPKKYSTEGVNANSLITFNYTPGAIVVSLLAQ